MVNIDTSEVKKFDHLAHDWWNFEGSSKALHDINPIRLKFITDILDLKGKKTLDVGCGGGILTESLAKQGAEVTGLDASKSAIEVAKNHAAEQKLVIDYQHSTVEAFLALKDKTSSFDVITCLELLEHVPDPESVVKACAKLVKPEGYVFFSTLHRNLKSFLFAIIGAEYLMGLIPKGTHEYAKFIRPSELEHFANKAGLSFQAIKGMGYRPFSKEYYLNEDVSVNYLVACQKL